MQTIQSTNNCQALPNILVECFPPALLRAIATSNARQIEELRLYRDRYARLIAQKRSYQLHTILSSTEMSDILKKMCADSLYAYSQSINQGYLTMTGGIRVGVCGKAAVENGQVIGVGEISGLVVRIPNKVSVSAKPILDCLEAHSFLKGVLIFAPPRVGKTTLLRALAKEAASDPYSLSTVAVDTREELAAYLEGATLNLNVLAAYPRKIGIEIAVRSLGAELILCDEIGSASDAEAILTAANCGVPLVATAHAASLLELLSRPPLLQLHRAQVFGAYIELARDELGNFHYRIYDRKDANRLLTSVLEEKK